MNKVPVPAGCSKYISKINPKQNYYRNPETGETQCEQSSIKEKDSELSQKKSENKSTEENQEKKSDYNEKETKLELRTVDNPNDNEGESKSLEMKLKFRKRKAVIEDDDHQKKKSSKTDNLELLTNANQTKSTVEIINEKNQTESKDSNTPEIDNISQKNENTKTPKANEKCNYLQKLQNEDFDGNKSAFKTENKKDSFAKNNTSQKKKFSVNDRLQKIQKESIAKHSIGIVKKIFPSKQLKKKFSVNERLQKLRAELQAKQRTKCNTNVITKFFGKDIIKLKNVESKSSIDKKSEKIKKDDCEVSFSSKIQPRKTNDNKKFGVKKFSVNDRLKMMQEELRAKRKSQVQDSNSKSDSDNSEKTNVQKNEESIEPMDIDMDWEPSNKEVDNTVKDLNISSMDCELMEQEIKKNIVEIRLQSPQNTTETLSDYYDTVEKNLLKLFAQNNKTTCKIIEKDKFYFVIDTNVFLKDLHFLNELVGLENYDKNKIVLIVPYIVLKELDSLKMRKDTAVSTLAVRAIKYLNNQYEEKNPNIQGQNAIEADKHLITIDSADDSLINCCLQIKEKTDYIALITHDINLKNKAITCDIKCFSKDDFENLKIIQ